MFFFFPAADPFKSKNIQLGNVFTIKSPPTILQITCAFSQQSFRSFLSSLLVLLYTPSAPPLYPHPPPTGLSTRRVSESAPSESSKGDRGGNESLHFKHRVPLLWSGTAAAGHAWETGSQVLGVGGSLGIQNDHWQALSPKDRMPLSPLRKASAFTDRRACSFCSVKKVLACKGWEMIAPDRALCPHSHGGGRMWRAVAPNSFQCTRE